MPNAPLSKPSRIRLKAKRCCDLGIHPHYYGMNTPTLKTSFLLTLAFTTLLWLIYAVVYYCNLNPQSLAVYPGSMAGLIGILSAPLMHGSWEHIAANTLPILLLGSMLLYGYPKSRWYALIIIWLGSGIGVWLFARPSFHFGASGLTHGLLFYLFIIGMLRRDKRSVALLMIAFMMYGGMLMTIFPREQGISYESHFFGAFFGVISALLFRHLDPKPAVKHYSWEDEQTDELGVAIWQPPR